MNVTRDALLQVVAAERAARKMSDFIQCMMSGTERPWNMADDIQSGLANALSEISGEDRNADFDKSETQILLRSRLSNEQVAEQIEKMAEKNAPKQPKPNLVNRVQFQEMVKRFGGYSAPTPEGEW